MRRRTRVVLIFAVIAIAACVGLLLSDVPQPIWGGGLHPHPRELAM